jgi:hypothetical protein
MQQPKPRKEALSGCGCETADVARAPTIHEGLVVFNGARGGPGDPRSALLGFLPSGGGGGGGGGGEREVLARRRRFGLGEEVGACGGD